jgi:DNA-binding beta-propeller fold protein YncE
VPAGHRPVRLALQRDGRYLWVASEGANPEKAALVAIDTETLEAVAHLPAGAGPHRLAVGDGDRHVYVADAGEGTLRVIEVATLAVVRELSLGSRLTGLAYSSLAGAVYALDAASGTLHVIDAQEHTPRARIELRPGHATVQFTPDGRWGFVLNRETATVEVLDATADRVAHRIEVPQPDQVAFTEGFAYVRSLASERITMIGLQELESGEAPVVAGFDAGTGVPGSVRRHGITGAVVPAPEAGAVVVANPADGGVYFYKEGMMAPKGSFQNWGSSVAGLEVVSRNLREREPEPGLYTVRIRPPASGAYELAFLLDSPRVVHCFPVSVAANPVFAERRERLEVDYSATEQRVQAGAQAELRVRLTQGGAPRADVQDLQAYYFLVPGRLARREPLRALGGGEYQASLPVPEAGAYYVYLESDALGLSMGGVPSVTLLATPGEQGEGRQ